MKCEMCKGDLADSLITCVEWKEDLPVIIKNTPVKVCIECKSEIFTPPVLEAIKKITAQEKAMKYINVPVFELTDEDTGDPRLNNPDYHPPAQCRIRCNTDLRSLKNLKTGKRKAKLWVKEDGNVTHPDKEVLKQLSRAFAPTPDSPVKKLVEADDSGYILYELKKSAEDEDMRQLPVAKMSFKENRWCLYWIWRSGIWQEYGYYSTLNQVVEQIKEDKLRFCA